jgi:hypothetical protein
VTLTRWDSLKRDIGGKFVGDPRAFAYFVPFWWLLSMVGPATVSEPGIFGPRMLANAIAFASCYGLLLVFRHTIFRHRHRQTVPVLTVMCAGVLLGATKGALTVSITAGLIGDWSYLDSLLLRTLAGAFTGAWFLPIAAIVLAIQDRYRLERDIVFAERLRHSHASPGGPLVEPSQIKLKQILEQIRHSIIEHGNNPQSLAQSLTELLDKRIRPLTKDLWAGSGRKYTDLSAVELQRIVVSRHHYSPTLTAIGLLISSGPFIVTTVGWSEGLGRAALTGPIAWAVLAALSRLPQSSSSQGIMTFLLGVSVFAGANELVAYVVFGQFHTLSPIVSGILNGTLFATLALLFGILRAARHELRDLRGELELLLGKEYFATRLELEHARARHRELAQVLHGRLQNQILGVVLSIAQDGKVASPTQLLEEIDLLDNAVTNHHPLPRFVNTGDLSQELESLANRWSGIVEVSVAHASRVDASGKHIDLLIGLAEEAVTNAVRHGLASSVSITLEAHTDYWELVVLDDGVGPRGGRPGLGTLTLNKATGIAWNLSPATSGVGSVLRASIPRHEGLSAQD